MAENGIEVGDIDEAGVLDEVLGNVAGEGFRRVSTQRLASQVRALLGPTHATRAELDADLDWTEGAIGTVWNDPTPENNADYAKSGGVGAGSWVYSGATPMSMATALAAKWASGAEDEEVEPGKFSAMHHALSAGSAAGQSAASAGEALAAANASQTARTQAEVAALAAGAKIFASEAAGLAGTVDGDVFLVIIGPGTAVFENDQGVASQLGWLGELLYDNGAALKGSLDTGFSEGQIIRTRAGGYAYRAALPTATDAHVVTDGGQKLYYDPDGNEVNLAALFPSTSSGNQDLLEVASAIATANETYVRVPQTKLKLTGVAECGDIPIIADDCEIDGAGFVRGKRVVGFRQSGVLDAAPAIRPQRPLADDTLKIVYVEEDDATPIMWLATLKGRKGGGGAFRWRATAGSPASTKDAGSPWGRMRQDYGYDILHSWVGVTTPAASNGTWDNYAVTASQWPGAAGASLKWSHFMQENETAGGEYIEYPVTPDHQGRFTVAFLASNLASNSVELKDQTKGVVIDTIDLSGSDVKIVILEFRASSQKNFTLRLTNNGTSGKTGLRVLGVNVFTVDSEWFNATETFDAFNFVYTGNRYVVKGSAATPVITARVDGNTVSGGNIHGGETLDNISWRLDGKEVATATPAAGTIMVGTSFALWQDTTIEWSDGQKLIYHERLEVAARGSVCCDWSWESENGVQVANIYSGMCPVDHGFNQIVSPVVETLGTPGEADLKYYPCRHGGQNSVTLRDPVAELEVEFQFTVYPGAQSAWGYPGGVMVLVGTTSDAYTKIYAPVLYGVNRLVFGSAGMTVTIWS